MQTGYKNKEGGRGRKGGKRRKQGKEEREEGKAEYLIQEVNISLETRKFPLP